MSISKDVIKQCLISKQREVDEAVIVNRPVDFEENGNYVIVGMRHAGKSYLLYQRMRQLQAAGKGWDEILNYFSKRQTNASAESLNSKIKCFRAQVKGVRDIPFFMYRLSTVLG